MIKVSEICVKLIWFHHLMIKGLPLRLHQLDTFWDINLLYVTPKNCEFPPQISKKSNCRKAICYLLKIIHKLLCFEKVLPISFNDHQLFCKICFLWPFDI